MEFDDLSTKSREVEKEVTMFQMKIQEVNNNLCKHRKDLECKYYKTVYDEILSLCYTYPYTFFQPLHLCCT